MILSDEFIGRIVEQLHAVGLINPASVTTLAGTLPQALLEKRVSRFGPKLQVKADLALLQTQADLAQIIAWMNKAVELASGAPMLRLIEIRDALEGDGIVAPRYVIDRGELAEILQRIIITDDTVPVDFLELGSTACKAVACIMVPIFRNNVDTNAQTAGTAWLIAPRHISTAAHVIHARNGAEMALASDLSLQWKGANVYFHYTEKHEFGLASRIEEIVVLDDDLDIAVLRLSEDPGCSPLKLWLAEPGPVVNILQHPKGGPKRLAMRNNAVVAGGAEKDLRYFTDTEEGSSGAPVMNDRFEVLAVHRAAQSINEGLQYLGRTVGVVNAGTRISVLLEKHPKLRGLLAGTRLSREELRALRTLASDGNFKRLEERLDALGEQDPNLGPFVQTMTGWAQALEKKSILIALDGASASVD